MKSAWQAKRSGDDTRAKRLWSELTRRPDLAPGVAASALLLMRALGLRDEAVEPRLSGRCALLPEEVRPPGGLDLWRGVLATLDRNRSALRHGGYLESLRGSSHRGWVVLMPKAPAGPSPSGCGGADFDRVEVVDRRIQEQ